MQALRGIHPVTKIGNARIRKTLRKKRQRKHGSREELKPAEEKQKWALNSLRIARWNEAGRTIPCSSSRAAGEMTTRKGVQLRKKVNRWAEEEKQRVRQKYQGVQLEKNALLRAGT